MSGQPRKIPEPYRAAARAALRAGWRIERTARHLAWTSPSGTVVITAPAPGGPRARLNDLAGLRRAGRPAWRRPRRPTKASARREGVAR
jgi:hypothetical protein